MSLSRPKSRFGGLNEQPGRRRLLRGAPATVFSNQREPSDDCASIERPPAALRYSALARRRVVDGSLCRTAARGGLVGLLPYALCFLSLLPLPRGHETAPANFACSF